MKTVEAIKSRIKTIQEVIVKLEEEKTKNKFKLMEDIRHTENLNQIASLIKRNEEEEKRLEEMIARRYDQLEMLGWVIEE